MANISTLVGSYFLNGPASILITFLLTVVVCFLAYRLLSPDKKYDPPLPPSPKSWLPIIGQLHLLDKDIRGPLRKFRRQFGDVYCLYFGTQPIIVIAGYKMLKQAFVKRAEAFECRPSLYLIDQITKGFGWIMADGEQWREHRRFTLSTLKELGMGRTQLEVRMLEETDRCIGAFRAHQGEPFDPKLVIGTSVSNIMCSMLFGGIFKNGDPAIDRMLKMFEENISASVGVVNFLPWLMMLPGDPLYAHRSLRNANDVFKFAYDLITEHTEDVSTDEDYIHAYIREMKRHQESGTSTTFSIDNLAGTISDMFIAGSETTSTILRWALVCMLTYPETQQRLFEEIKETIGIDRPPSVLERSKIPYVEAFYMETLRYCNLTITSGLHAANQTLVFEGYTIPAEAIVLPDLDSVMFDAEIWGDPENFRPERFLDDNGCLQRKEEFVPFFMGKRSCIGEALARMELFVFLTSLIQNFQISAAPGETVSMATADGEFGFVHGPKPFKIVAVPRK